MNTDHEELIELIHACLDGRATDQEACRLNARLRADAAARDLYLQLADTHSCLAVDESLWVDSIGSASAPDFRLPSARQRWLSWRPLLAAAAGIVFGMFCTSVVFGIVTERAGVVKRVPLPIFDPGMENPAPITEQRVPQRVGEWGADGAQVVAAENGVRPLGGQRMLRLEPIPRAKPVKSHTSRAYQVCDLRSLPPEAVRGTSEVQVTASFFATESQFSSRYLIRAFALNEAPEAATQDFWAKAEDDGVVSMSQRFDTTPGVRGWHTFSLKMPLPDGAKTLVIILGAMPPTDPAVEPSVHYLDEVSVALLTSEPTLP